MTTKAVRWMVALSAAACVLPAAAQEPSMQALERAFWQCDHATTTGALDGGAAAQCSVVTEAFKARRFGGDFQALLAWWRANKDAQHLALSAAAGQRLTSAAPRP